MTMKKILRSVVAGAGALGAIATIGAIGCSSTGDDVPEQGTAHDASNSRVPQRALGTAAKSVRQVQHLEILAAAQRELASYLERIPSGQEADFGFSDASELAQVRLGVPYEYFTLSDAAEALPEDLWAVPLLVGGATRALIKVGLEGAELKVKAFGSSGLAAQLDGLEQARVAAGAGAGSARAILRSFKHVATFVSYDADLRQAGGLEQAEIHPLDSARVAFADRTDVLTAAQRGRAVTAGLSASTLKALIVR
jgi:hypothetical protein